MRCGTGLVRRGYVVCLILAAFLASEAWAQRPAGNSPAEQKNNSPSQVPVQPASQAAVPGPGAKDVSGQTADPNKDSAEKTTIVKLGPGVLHRPL